MGSASGTAVAEVEDRESLDKEHTYPLHGGHSLRDVVTTQGTCQLIDVY